MQPEARCFVVGSGEAAQVKERVSRQNPGLVVQAVQPKAASNEFFVELIAAQTLRAAETGNLLAKKPEIDLLLRLAETTQISVAIARLGARRGEPFLLVAAGRRELMAELGQQPGWTRLARAGLTEREKERIERAALLNVVRG